MALPLEDEGVHLQQGVGRRGRAPPKVCAVPDGAGVLRHRQLELQRPQFPPILEAQHGTSEKNSNI